MYFPAYIFLVSAFQEDSSLTKGNWIQVLFVFLYKISKIFKKSALIQIETNF